MIIPCRHFNGHFAANILFAVCLLLAIFAAILFAADDSWYEPGKTRSLSGGFATNGSEETVSMVLTLMRVGIMEGYAVRRIKMFNDRVYLSRYRRSYWFGSRFYALDNNHFLETRETCAYRMRAEERRGLEYEEEPEEPILDIVYQCQKYAQYCCGLDCCDRYLLI